MDDSNKNVQAGHILLGFLRRSLENESETNECNFTVAELRDIHQSLIVFNNGEIFDDIAESAYLGYDEASKVDRIAKLQSGLIQAVKDQSDDTISKNQNVKYYKEKGFVLFDDTYPSAFGRLEYIYRAKGLRTIWFESGKLMLVSVYAYLDEHGFDYVCEEIDTLDLFWDEYEENGVFDLYWLANSVSTPELGKEARLIKCLCNINMPFTRSYMLEHLFTPADVLCISEYSRVLRENIWQFIIDMYRDYVFKNEGDINFIKYCISFLNSINVDIPSYILIDLIDKILENNADNKKLYSGLLSILKSTYKENEQKEEEINYPELIQELKDIKPGNKDAGKYQKYIYDVINLIFDRYLFRPYFEAEINEGRKRIDILYDNIGGDGFFYELKNNYNILCPKIIIECKNYSSNLKNPEIDQLIGRFGKYIGYFGIMVCRKIEDEHKLLERCKDTLHKEQGFIICLSDENIVDLLKLRQKRDYKAITEYLTNIFNRLIL